MNRFQKLFLISFGVSLGLLAGLQFSQSNVLATVNRLITSEERRIVNVIANSRPAVVSVLVKKSLPILEFEEIQIFDGVTVVVPKDSQQLLEQQVSGGTGFFISKEGLLVTNEHVVQDTEAAYTVVDNEGNIYEATVLLRNTEKDLAILRVKGDDFPVLKMSSNDVVSLGQTVVAIGNSLGEFKNTISKGIISGMGRNVVTNTGKVFEEVIQTDAAINVGNSGGPLLDTRGEVIGINFSTIVGAENISFAIPVSMLKKLLDDAREKK